MPQFFRQFFRWCYNQFRLQKFLQEVIVIAVVGVQILPGNYLDQCSEAAAIPAFTYRVESIIVTEVAECFVICQDSCNA